MRHHGCRELFSVAVVLWLLAWTGIAGAQTWVELSPTGPPTPDFPYSLKHAFYDSTSNRLIVFFADNPSIGTEPGPQVWALTHANGLGGPPVWIPLMPAGSPPFANGLEAAVYDETNNRLIVYGGCWFGCSPALGNVFVLSHANGLGGSPAWTESSTVPFQPRVDHSAVLDEANNVMITFGGHFAFYGTDQSDTRTLSNANGMASPSTWTTLATTMGPPGSRGRHSAIYDAASNRMTIFGGENLISTCCPYLQSDYGDSWVLTNANGLGGTPVWMNLLPSGTPPQVRSGHSAVYDPVNNRMIVFGGSAWVQATQNSTFLGDLWELSYANGIGGTPAWTPILAAGTAPTPRTYHWAAFDSATQRMILFGGRHDTENPPGDNRVWVLIFTTPVSIDIKPGSYPNSINPKSKWLIPVAILTTASFDATTVDPASVRFGPGGATEAHGTGHIEDVDGDGDDDLMLHFKTQATGIQCGATSAALTGQTQGGQPIEGIDSVRTVGCS